MLSFYRKMRRRFYEGPDWVQPPSYLIGRGYRSPTVLLITWGYACIVRYLTIPGRIVIPVSFMILSYSLTILQNPVRVLAFGLISIFAADFVLGFIFRPRLSVSRKVPDRVRAGHPFTVSYSLSNRRSLPVWDVCLDSLPYCGEIKAESEIQSLACIEEGGNVSVSRTMVGSRRGQYRLYAAIAESTFPFTIFKWSCRGACPDKIIVHPDYTPLSSLFLPVGSKYQREGNSMISKIGESMDFIGCREFRTGDNPKHIHWPSSARAGELVVREFQEEYLSRVAIVMDTYVPPIRSPLDLIPGRKSRRLENFEAVIHLSAAIADYLSRSEYLIDLFAAGPNVYHFKGGRHTSSIEQVLDIISCLAPNHKEPIAELSPEIMDIVSEIGSALLILLKWDEPRRNLWKQLNDNGVAVKTIVVSDDGSGIPPQFAVLAPEDILRGEIRSL